MHINLVVNSNSKAKSLSDYSEILVKALQDKNVNLKIFDPNSKVNPLISILFRLINIDIKSILRNTPLLKKLPTGIVHFTNQFQAFPLVYQKRKSVVTVHDILPIINKDYGLIQRCFYRLIFEGLKKADLLISDSYFTKETLIKRLGISSEKIKVAHLGVDSSKFKILKKIKKEKNRILYVGSEMPRKNLGVLLKAFAEVKKRIPDAKLVKIGKPQWKNVRNRHISLCIKLGIKESVMFKDYVEDITTEYNKSELFVFPSLYEGFGLPILEAMACGVPVICSNRTSLPEIAGDAAVYFNGNDIKNLADKMADILKNRKKQKQMITRGLKRIILFSWEKCIQKTILAYQQLT